MTTQSVDRIHRAVSADGTEIGGRVFGQGPPVVFVHGAMDDGSDWTGVVPYLADRFTCFLMTTRCRGLSGAHPDLSTERRVQDVTAFVDSIGDAVGLAGVSGGGMVALGAAVHARGVSAVVAYEPVVFEVIGEQVLQEFRDRLARMTEAAVQSRPGDAARLFLEFAANDEELAALAATDVDTAATRHLPIDLLEFRQTIDGPGPSPTDPRMLAGISVPTLLLRGTRTAQPWFEDGIQHVAEHVPGARVSDIEGAGHLGPIARPEAVAAELARFLEPSTR
jgi:pimeloyl-ACP methyl ester carboxylesterase